MAKGPDVVLCLDLTPLARTRLELLATRSKIRDIERFLATQRGEGAVVLHLRQQSAATLETMTRLRPAEGETVFIRPDETGAFGFLPFRAYLDSLNPNLVRVLCGSRGEASADFCMRLTNVGYDVIWMSIDLEPDFNRPGAAHIATLTEVTHPRLTHRALAGQPNDGGRRANEA